MAPDQVVLLLVQDNIELACRVIEKAAMDRAVADVDENFASSYDLRRRHRQVSVFLGPLFCRFNLRVP
jgi:CCR4-NOT transcription complex subunit 1